MSLAQKKLAKPAKNNAETVGQVARHFGVSETSIHNWLRKGMPGGVGAYDLDECEKWKANNVGKRPVKSPVSESLAAVTLEQECLKRDVLLEKKRDLLHRRKIRERNILPRSEYEEFLREVIIVTRDCIQSLPGQLAKLGANPIQQGGIYAETERIVRSALQQMEEMLARKGEAFE